MKRIILLSHSNLSKGMRDTTSLILGEQKNLYSVTAYVNDDKPFIEEVKSLLNSFDEKDSVIFITDLFGGSVNNEMIKFVENRENYYLVTGMNLNLILEILIDASDISIEELIKRSAERAKEGIIYCKSLSKNYLEDDF